MNAASSASVRPMIKPISESLTGLGEIGLVGSVAGTAIETGVTNCASVSRRETWPMIA